MELAADAANARKGNPHWKTAMLSGQPGEGLFAVDGFPASGGSAAGTFFLPCPHQPAGSSTVQRYFRRAEVMKTIIEHGVIISERTKILLTNIKTLIVHAWNFVFNHNVSPLRHIPDVAVRHYVLQVLGLMWAVAFSIAIGSYTFLAASIIGHSVLIAAAAVTVATFTVAAKRPKVFMRGAGRRSNGEHD